MFKKSLGKSRAFLLPKKGGKIEEGFKEINGQAYRLVLEDRILKIQWLGFIRRLVEEIREITAKLAREGYVVMPPRKNHIKVKK